VRTDIAVDEIALHYRHSPPMPSRRTLVATLDGFEIRSLDVPIDAPTLHGWFVEERAAFWNMRDWSMAQVAAFYQAIDDSLHARAWLASQQGKPAFLIESYDPAHEEVGEHYDVQPGDLGMHLFVGPPATRQPGYTRRVFRTLMRFLFEHLGATRIVVEPDARNTRIHALNRAMGFVYAKDVAFREKTASLAFCTRADFYAAIQHDI
jgi:RimJ/RimL family protein N-acetyltransferase